MQYRADAWSATEVETMLAQTLDAALLAAAEADRRLKMYLQRSPLTCIIWDRNHIVREWNSAAEEMFGMCICRRCSSQRVPA